MTVARGEAVVVEGGVDDLVERGALGETAVAAEAEVEYDKGE